MSADSSLLIDKIQECCIQDLQRPRLISSQVMQTLADRYSTDQNDLIAFFSEQYAQFDDVEMDLVFSPLFTPTLEDRLPYAALMQETCLSAEDAQQLLKNLALNSGAQQLTATFKAPDGRQYTAPLHEVSIDRYVTRLYLERVLDNPVYDGIGQTVPHEHQPLVNTIAREPVWQSAERQQLLLSFLKIFQTDESGYSEKIIYLTDFVRTYRPADMEAMVRQLQSLIESCKKDLQNVHDRGFHSHHLKGNYQDSDVAHRQEEIEKVTENYTHMTDMASALLAGIEAQLKPSLK
ncbi:MAG: hypothetical protein KTR14_03450 [Vampirovibrio sp.]|nr:hypothetical protein [Vampirovibrio sp.]